MFHGILEKLFSIANAFPIRVRGQASVFRRASVCVFPGLGFQESFKVSGITRVDVGQRLVRTKKQNQVPLRMPPIRLGF